MRHHHQQHHHPATTVVAIRGPNTLVEDILERLLEREGYSARHLEAYPTGLMDELLDGADVVLLAPGLDAEMRAAFLEAMRSIPKTAAIPVHSLSPALKLALLDELSASASWRSLFEELVIQIGAALVKRAAVSARAPLAKGGEEPAVQADASL
jgi:hypothetical protein